MKGTGRGRAWLIGLVAACMLGSAGPAFGFGEVFQMTGSGKIWHFESGPFTPAPTTSFNGTAASAFIAQNLDPDGMGFVCWENGTTLLADTDPDFPSPIVFTGLLSSAGPFMVFTTQDGNAIMLSGVSIMNNNGSAITRVRGEAWALTMPPQMYPGAAADAWFFDHFSKAKFDTVKLISTGGCQDNED